jgi:hypothetical protein
MPSVIGSVNGVDVAANFQKNVRANGLGPRTIIVKIAKTDITNTELNTIVNYMTTSHGSNGTGDSAFVVAGLSGAAGAAFVSGTTDVVFLALQGTGNYTVAGSDAHGVTGAVTTIEAIFDQNYQ